MEFSFKNKKKKHCWNTTILLIVQYIWNSLSKLMESVKQNRGLWIIIHNPLPNIITAVTNLWKMELCQVTEPYSFCILLMAKDILQTVYLKYILYNDLIWENIQSSSHIEWNNSIYIVMELLLHFAHENFTSHKKMFCCLWLLQVSSHPLHLLVHMVAQLVSSLAPHQVAAFKQTCAVMGYHTVSEERMKVAATFITPSAPSQTGGNRRNI